MRKYGDYQPRLNKKIRDANKQTKFPLIELFILILALGTIYTVAYFRNQKAGTVKGTKIVINSPRIEAPVPTLTPSQSSQNQKVEQIFANDIPHLEGHWAVIVKNVKSQKTYSYNGLDIFPSASLYKLEVMWSTFQAIDNGNLKEDSAAEAWTVSDALSAMITVSDNDAAISLAEDLGWDKIEQDMKKEGFSSVDLTSEDSPFINAKDTEAILERIYNNTAVSQTASEQMKKLLFSQQINDRIPADLPPDVQVGHKTGEIDNYRHDAGIVIGKKSDYIFVFLTETPNPGDTPDTIATLSKKLYDALESQ
ncbi:MAG TPA: serine hydrolase [Candidatus Saccharimonadales bacterium]|nr:serine hydrolase [Candidatus Saccharimonadales bacterium]